MTLAEHKLTSEKAKATLSDLIASGRATCSVEEAAEIWGVGRCTAYEEAVSTFGAIRVGRKLRVSVPRLLNLLGLPLPAEWQPAVALASRCQCAEAASDSDGIGTAYPKVGAAACAPPAASCRDLSTENDFGRG